MRVLFCLRTLHAMYKHFFSHWFWQEGQVSMLAGTGPDSSRVAYVKTVQPGGPYGQNVRHFPFHFLILGVFYISSVFVYMYFYGHFHFLHLYVLFPGGGDEA